MKEKIIFIAHPYHQKTKSCDFLIDYLETFYIVEVFYNDSEEIDENKDLSFIDNSYKAVIFWQLFPLNIKFNKIDNDNIIFFPMYDLSKDWNFEKWSFFRDVKIINFSKALHKKLNAAGYNSIYFQFFPEPKEFCAGKNNEVFFWQRHSEINFGTIKKMLSEDALKIHIHTAVDPDNAFYRPTLEDENKYRISYSSWLDTKQEMLELIKDKAIYIAPRQEEGIGMSFLEAMSEGKAVIANNEATMNEYIIDGKTGYLCDFKKPKKIDLSNIEQIQKNAYDYVKTGYEKWLKDRSGIIQFIEIPVKKSVFSILQKIKMFLIFSDKKDIIRLKFGSKGYFKLLGVYLIDNQ